MCIWIILSFGWCLNKFVIALFWSVCNFCMSYLLRRYDFSCMYKFGEWDTFLLKALFIIYPTATILFRLLTLPSLKIFINRWDQLRTWACSICHTNVSIYWQFNIQYLSLKWISNLFIYSKISKALYNKPTTCLQLWASLIEI